MEDSKVFQKASDILQLCTLSVLTLPGKNMMATISNLTSPDLRSENITDGGLESLPQGLRHLTALHTINLDFSW